VEALEKLKAQALKVVRWNQGLKELSAEELFDLFANGQDKIKEKDWLSFFSTAEMEVKACFVKAEEKAVEEAAEKDAEMKEEEVAEKDAEKKDEEDAEKKEEDAKADGEDAEQKEGEEKKEEVEEKKEEVKKVVKISPKKEEPKEEKVEKIELSKEELSRVFAYADEDEDGFLSKDRFLMLVKRHMKVVKETAMTTQMTVAGSKALRKLELTEVVEVLKGPIREGAMTVSRILCKTQKDDLEGWVSVAGNKGTVFMEDAGNFFKVIKTTGLTDSFESMEATDDNKLSHGTVLEVREKPKKDEESGITRMKGRVLSTKKKIGWVTISTKDGKVFCKQAGA